MTKLISIIYRISLFLILSGISTVALAQQSFIKGNAENLINPVVSPDGSYIALMTVDYSSMWVVRSDGYLLRKFSDKPASGKNVSWSPDSRWLIIHENVLEGDIVVSKLKVAEVFNKNISNIKVPYRQLDEFGFYGSDLIFIRNKNDIRFIRSGLSVKTAGKKIKPYVHIIKNKIIFEYADISKSFSVNPLIGARYVNAELSPDGKMIVFEALNEGIYVYRMASFDLFELGVGQNPKWSPDSKNVVYQIANYVGKTPVSSDIYINNAQGTGKLRLTRTQNILEMRPSFVPNKRKIVFDTEMLGKIMTIRIP